MSVYVMQDKETGLHKIGRAGNPSTRRRGIELKVEHSITLVTTIRTTDDVRLEQALHSQFSDKRLHGEWFELDDEELEWLKQEDYIHGVLAKLFLNSESDQLIGVEPVV